MRAPYLLAGGLVGWPVATRPTGPDGPGEADVVTAQIVAAVRAGDDERIRELLPRLAVCADVAALYALRDALGGEVSATAVPSSPAGTGAEGPAAGRR